MKNLTASDRSALIKLASELPKGDETRKVILAGLVMKASEDPDSEEPDWKEIKKLYQEILDIANKIDGMLRKSTGNYDSTYKYQISPVLNAVKKALKK